MFKCEALLLEVFKVGSQKSILLIIVKILLNFWLKSLIDQIIDALLSCTHVFVLLSAIEFDGKLFGEFIQSFFGDGVRLVRLIFVKKQVQVRKFDIFFSFFWLSIQLPLVDLLELRLVRLVYEAFFWEHCGQRQVKFVLFEDQLDSFVRIAYKIQKFVIE